MAKMRLNNVRLAFSQLFEAKKINGEGEAKFSCAFLMPPDHEDVAKVEAEMESVGKEKWKDKWPAVKKQLMAQDKMALHDGDVKANYAGYPGMMFVNASNAVQPKLKDYDKSPITSKASGKLYSGCYVNGVIEIWAQDNQYGKRINATLLGVQHRDEGEPFSGGQQASDADFEELAAPAGSDLL